MSLTNGAQTVDVFMDKRVVKSGAVGATSLEEIKWLTETLVSSSSQWKDEGWGYIVDIRKMSPVTTDISRELIHMHKRLAEAGCKAMAFVESKSVYTSVQAKVHHKMSNTQILEGHFVTEDEAFVWLGKNLD